MDSYNNTSWHGINQKLSKRYGCKINYRIENAETLSYKDNYFDRVYSISVLEHCRAIDLTKPNEVPLSKEDLQLQRSIVKEMVRVLKPGGLCVITVDFYIPRGKFLLESNVNIKNILNIDGIDVIGS